MRSGMLGVLAAAGLSLAATDQYRSIQHKFELIEQEGLKPGTRVELTPAELKAYCEQQLPAGVRNPNVRLAAGNTAVGSALIDFGKVRRAQGYQPGWLMSKLLDGERPVTVTARIRSGGGRATVDVEKVEISGLVIDGRTLEFLIQNFLLPMYPDAAVSRPFELGHRIEKLEVGPAVVGVVIGR